MVHANSDDEEPRTHATCREAFDAWGQRSSVGQVEAARRVVRKAGHDRLSKQRRAAKAQMAAIASETLAAVLATVLVADTSDDEDTADLKAAVV